MKRIPSFSITIHVIEGIILVYPGSANLIPTKSIRKLRHKLEDCIERIKELL